MLRIMLLTAATILVFGHVTELRAQNVRIDCPLFVSAKLFSAQSPNYTYAGGSLSDPVGQVWQKSPMRTQLVISEAFEHNKKIICRYHAELATVGRLIVTTDLTATLPPGLNCVVDERGATCSQSLSINPESGLPVGKGAGQPGQAGILPPRGVIIQPPERVFVLPSQPANPQTPAILIVPR